MKKKSKLKTVNLQYNGMIVYKDSYDKAYRKILNNLPTNLWLFLIKKNKLKRYLDCCIGRYYDHNLKSLLIVYSNFGTAFAWSLSKEGALFWNKMSEEYEKRTT